LGICHYWVRNIWRTIEHPGVQTSAQGVDTNHAWNGVTGLPIEQQGVIEIMEGRLANTTIYFGLVVEINQTANSRGKQLHACTVLVLAFVPPWFIKQTHILLGLLYFSSLVDFHFLSSHIDLRHPLLPLFSVFHLKHPG
jgi:hypothetical protein